RLVHSSFHYSILYTNYIILHFTFFFFTDTPTTEIYTLSLHDALPIWCGRAAPPRDCSRASAWTTTAIRRPSVRWPRSPCPTRARSEEHTSELQSRGHLVCRLLLEKKNTNKRCSP